MEGTDRPLLSVVGLRKVFGELSALIDIDLHVDTGEAVAVIGPNGAGKTTLLRCIVGTDRPSAGTVELCGRPLHEHETATRRQVAAAVEDIDFFVDLSVVEHLALLLLAHGDAAPDQHAVDLLTEANLAELTDQLPAGLSSGQRSRLALVTCFARPRALVVLDEPEQHLDRDGRRWLIRRLQREKELGHGVLIATHDDQLARTAADRVVDLGETRS